jgi:dTDP-4-dehydrorhamnose reductase
LIEFPRIRILGGRFHASEPYVESDGPSPQTVYGRSKFAGEQAVRSENPDHLVVRTAWVFSKYGRNFVKTILSAAQKRKRLQVVADQFGNPTEAYDVADGLLAAARFWRDHQGFPQGLYHLAGQGSASWYEVARQTLETSKAMGGPIADVEPIARDQWVAKASARRTPN